MTISSFLTELKSRNKLLYWTGIIHLALLVLFFIMYFVDDTEVLGINAWIKPMKFAISIAAYAWTFGWLLHYVRSSGFWVKLVSWVICLSMFVEMICIALQSFRGTRSHFNFDTPEDSLIFAAMGIGILFNTGAIIIAIILFYVKKPDLKIPYLWSIRLALVVFFLANLIGGMMIGNGAHSIGGTDGGPGLPFVNWSIEFGDLRVAHFLGLHSIQIIPLFAFFLESRTQMTSKKQLWAVIGFTLLISLFFAAVYFQAISGKPLI